MQIVLSFKLFPASAHAESLALFRMEAHVLSILLLTHIKIILEYGLVLFCGDKGIDRWCHQQTVWSWSLAVGEGH